MAKEKTELKLLTANDVGNLLKKGEVTIRAGKATIVTKKKVKGEEVDQITYLPLAPVVAEVVVDEDEVSEEKPVRRRGRPPKADKDDAPKRRRGRPPKKDEDAPKRRRGRPPKADKEESEDKPKRRRGRPPKTDKEELAPKKEKPSTSVPWDADDFDESDFSL